MTYYEDVLTGVDLSTRIGRVVTSGNNTWEDGAGYGVGEPVLPFQLADFYNYTNCARLDFTLSGDMNHNVGLIGGELSAFDYGVTQINDDSEEDKYTELFLGIMGEEFIGHEVIIKPPLGAGSHSITVVINPFAHCQMYLDDVLYIDFLYSEIAVLFGHPSGFNFGEDAPLTYKRTLFSIETGPLVISIDLYAISDQCGGNNTSGGCLEKLIYDDFSYGDGTRIDGQTPTNGYTPWVTADTPHPFPDLIIHNGTVISIGNEYLERVSTDVGFFPIRSMIRVFARNLRGQQAWIANHLYQNIVITYGEAAVRFACLRTFDPVPLSGLTGPNPMPSGGFTITGEIHWNLFGFNLAAVTWSAGHTYTGADGFLLAAGYIFSRNVNGPTGGSEPSWPLTYGSTVVDGSITWTNYGEYAELTANTRFGFKSYSTFGYGGIVDTPYPGRTHAANGRIYEPINFSGPTTSGGSEPDWNTFEGVANNIILDLPQMGWEDSTVYSGDGIIAPPSVGVYAGGYYAYTDRCTIGLNRATDFVTSYDLADIMEDGDSLELVVNPYGNVTVAHNGSIVITTPWVASAPYTDAIDAGFLIGPYTSEGTYTGDPYADEYGISYWEGQGCYSNPPEVPLPPPVISTDLDTGVITVGPENIQDTVTRPRDVQATITG